eukprot:evm.model.NODE_5287_length_31514_cov_28.831980.10
MLEYDDSAFYYFCMTMLSFYMLPGTYYLVFKQLLPALLPRTDAGLAPRTEAERRKAKQLKEEARSSNKLMSCGVITNAILLTLTYALFVFLVLRVWNDAEIAQFDPYAILEIATDAEDRAIRKAYRSLSLKWHPDKNMGNQYAEQMFMMVRKAYEALTDEVAKENWQKYGNPDGKQALEVSIGLPTFLLEKDNHTTILLVYLVVLVIAIPLAVYCWYSESQQYGENNVMHRTYNDYAALLAEATPPRYLPSILVTSNECVKANASSSPSPSLPPSSSTTLTAPGAAGAAIALIPGMDPAEAKDLNKLVAALGPTRLVKPKHEKHLKALAEVTKGNVLLHAYLYRLEIPPRFHENLRKMLCLSGDLIEAMLEILQKTRWLQTALGVLDFQQQLTQAIMKVEFDVIKASDLPEYIPHKDDLELDNEPTLFESLAGNLEDDSDSDLEMEEEEGEEGMDGGEGEKEVGAKKDD